MSILSVCAPLRTWYVLWIYSMSYTYIYFLTALCIYCVHFPLGFVSEVPSMKTWAGHVLKISGASLAQDSSLQKNFLPIHINRWALSSQSTHTINVEYMHITWTMYEKHTKPLESIHNTHREDIYPGLYTQHTHWYIMSSDSPVSGSQQIVWDESQAEYFILRLYLYMKDSPSLQHTGYPWGRPVWSDLIC